MPEQFFVNYQDLMGWVKSRESSDDAAIKLIDVIKQYSPNASYDENDIKETCTEIFTGENEDSKEYAAKTLFGVLAKHNIVTFKKEASNMNKTVQAESRQRNGWERGMRNKWNRVVDGFNEGTPWRVDRDKFYNFTHYYTDAITFDEDPTKVYSGEALWRNYIMDKYTREYQDKDGRWVGGYINDRFYVFPDAGTPDNPKVDRMQGNQMELAPGERTRKPRPHQWSVERRMEEARGHKTSDLEAKSNSFNKIVKIASTSNKETIDNDKIYNIFKDAIEMKEAGMEYEKRINMLSDHYKTKITHVAQIIKIAESMIKKHENIGYKFSQNQNLTTHMLKSETKAKSNVGKNAGNIITLPAGTTVVQKSENEFEVVDGEFTGEIVQFNMTQTTNTNDVQPQNISNTQNTNLEALDTEEENIQDAASETGLNEM